MRVLVCGGRDYSDWKKVYEVLDQLYEDQVNHPLMIIEGGARGADAAASEWADAMGLPHARVAALWNMWGASAGHQRNAAMLELKPDLVVAFPGGKGTEDMVRQAKRAGIFVRRIT